MKRIIVFSTTLAAVLVAGVALAFVGSPEPETLAGGEERNVTTTTTDQRERDVVVDDFDEPESDETGDSADTESDESKKDESKDEPDEDTDPPDLVILYPEEGAHFTETHLAFEGIVEPGARVVAAGYEADVDDEGHWRIVLILAPGGNLAKFTAIDGAGNESTAQVKVYLDAGDDKETEEPKETEFVAKQKYGSCGEEAPYDIWYGSGTPGTEVWVASDFGSGHTVVGEHGEWELKVFFEEAPCNDEFAVVVETDSGYRKVFEFIRLCDEGDK